MACLRSDLESLRKARVLVDDVFACVQPGSLYERPIPQRHRMNFYIGHVEAFDSNLLSSEVGIPPADPELDRLFAFGIDPEPGQLPSDQTSDWPDLTRTQNYRDRVRQSVDAHWQQVPEYLRRVALEHRLMHVETLAYLIHNFPTGKLVKPPVKEGAETNGSVRAERADIPAGTAILGSRPDDGFGWDNEFARQDVQVDAFTIDRWKVTNGAYLEFVRAGASAPHYWVDRSGKWFLRRMFDEVPLPLDWPVWTTQEEATAFANWQGAALPSEAQWHRAADGAPCEVGNFDGRRFDPAPVTAYPESASAFGVEDLCGNGWEWTSSLFRPFPGFEPFSFYPGYSAPFFDDDHFVLKGASPRTDGVFLRRSFRNWFRKDYPFVFAAFRCIHKQR